MGGHLTSTSPSTDPNSSVFQGHGVIVAVGKSLYQAAQAVTGIVGVTPIQIAEGVGCLLALTLIYMTIQGMRGKTAFSLSREDTVIQYEEGHKR